MLASTMSWAHANAEMLALGLAEEGKAGKPSGPHPTVGAGVASVAAGLANLASGQ